MEKLIVLKLKLSNKEFDSSAKLRDKIDTFTTMVNDRLCDKFSEEIMFDATFSEDGKIMIFTLDSPKALKETCKTIDKLLKNKKFASFNEKRITFEEENACNLI